MNRSADSPTPPTVVTGGTPLLYAQPSPPTEDSLAHSELPSTTHTDPSQGSSDQSGVSPTFQAARKSFLHAVPDGGDSAPRAASSSTGCLADVLPASFSFSRLSRSATKSASAEKLPSTVSSRTEQNALEDVLPLRGSASPWSARAETSFSTQELCRVSLEVSAHVAAGGAAGPSPLQRSTASLVPPVVSETAHTPLGTVASSARRLDLTSSSTTTPSTATGDTSSLAARALTTAGTTSNTLGDERTGSSSSDSRVRRRPPRLALRLFDQPDDADSSLDQSRAADRTTAASSIGGAPNVSTSDVLGRSAFRAPLFADASHNTSSPGRDEDGDDETVFGDPPPFLMDPNTSDMDITWLHPSADTSFSYIRTTAPLADGGCDVAPRRSSSSGRRASRRQAHGHHDDTEQPDRELAELLSFQTPLSPCASSTAPQFAVMASRSSTSHFSPVTVGSAFERGNSMTLGPNRRGTHGHVSSRAIVENHLRRQQQQHHQQQQGPPSSYRTNQSGSIQGAESTNGSFALSHHSPLSHSRSPSWPVSRGLSPQSPAAAAAASTFPNALVVPITPLQTFSAFPSCPASGVRPLLPSCKTTPIAAAPPTMNASPHPELNSHIDPVSVNLPARAETEQGEDRDEDEEAEEDTIADDVPLCVVVKRRNTLEPAAALAEHGYASSNSISRDVDSATPSAANDAIHTPDSPSLPGMEPTLSSASAPSTLPRHSCSPVRQVPHDRHRHHPTTTSPRSGGSTRGSSPRFSASASYAALTLGRLMTPEEHDRSPQPEMYTSLSSFPLRSGTATPMRARMELGAPLPLATQNHNHHLPRRRNSFAEQALSFADADEVVVEVSDLRTQSARTASTLTRGFPSARWTTSARDASPLSLDAHVPLTTSSLSASPLFLLGRSREKLGPSSGRHEHSPILSATPPPPPLPPRAMRINSSREPEWNGASQAQPNALVHTSSLDDFTIRSQNPSLTEALRAIGSDGGGAAAMRSDGSRFTSVDGMVLPHVLHTNANAVDNSHNHQSDYEPLLTTPRTTTTTATTTDATSLRLPHRKRTRLPHTAPSALLPLFGQLSARGCRSYQEDSVLLLPDIHVRLDASAPASADLSPRTGVPTTAPSDDARTTNTKAFACFGVFDGHNGDEVSTMAQQYFLDHFEVSYQHYHAQEAQQQQQQQKREQKQQHHDSDYEAKPHCGAPPSSCSDDDVDQASESVLNTSTDDDHRTLSAALVQTLLHLDVTIYDQLRTSKGEAGSTAVVMACAVPEEGEIEQRVSQRMHNEKPPSAGQSTEPVRHRNSDDDDDEDDDGVCGVDYLDVAIANLGDSRAVVGNVATGAMILETVDHRVRTYPTEEDRITRCGGTVEFDRVEGCYDVTRGLGDYHLKCSPTTWWAASSVSAFSGTHAANSAAIGECGEIPMNGAKGSSLASNGHASGEIRGNVIGNIADVYEVRVGAGDFVILASDGVWDRVSSQEAVAFVAEALQPFFDACSLASTAVMEDTTRQGDFSHGSDHRRRPSQDDIRDHDERVDKTGEVPQASACLDCTSASSSCPMPLQQSHPRGATTSSAGLTSEGPARSPTASSLPTLGRFTDDLSSSPLRAVTSCDTVAVPGSLASQDVAATSNADHATPKRRPRCGNGHYPSDDENDNEDGNDSHRTPSRRTKTSSDADQARSPSFRMPACGCAEPAGRSAAAANPETQERTTPPSGSRGRRFRQLSAVDLVQRDAIPTELLERRVQQQQQQQQQQSTPHNRIRSSGFLYTPSSSDTPYSGACQPPSAFEESDCASTSASSPPRLAQGGGAASNASTAMRDLVLPPQDAAHAPWSGTETHCETTGAINEIHSTPKRVSTKTTSFLEFQTPSRPSPESGAADAFDVANLSQMVRKVSAGLADYALLERNSSDNVTVVLVVFAPIPTTESCPIFASSVTGFQSP